MSVCTSCGATISRGEVTCLQCGKAIGAADKSPGSGRRAITGIIGIPLVALGLFLIVIGALGVGCSDDTLECDIGRIISVVVGVGASLLGTPFALATVVPFGTPRRILVGLGFAMFAAVGAGTLAGVTAGWGPGISGPALAAFAGFFAFGYWIAR